jgi:hypothetical protein
LENVQIIDGPVAPCGQEPIYHVTLASGAIATRASSFGVTESATPIVAKPVITADGRVLRPAE